MASRLKATKRAAPTLVATAGKRAKLTASTSTSKKGVKGTTTKKIPNKSEGKPADERDSSPSSHKKRTSKLRDTRPPRNGNEDSLKTTNPSPSDNTATDLEAVDQIVSKTTSDIEPASAEDEEVEEEEEEEDHAAKLLRGFESDSSNDEDEQVGPVDVSNLPEIPDTAKALQRLKVSGDGPGVIYIGRVPHGFYEHQVEAYFSQFGTILRLRLSRNKKTGRSKHYGFIEFASAEVARIVALTMNKYLLFGHILQVRVIPPDQVHPTLFRGAGKRFRPIPRNMLERKALKTGQDRARWERRIKAEEARRKNKSQKLQDLLGYEYKMPQLKSVHDIPIRTTDVTKLVVGNEGDQNLETAAAGQLCIAAV